MAGIGLLPLGIGTIVVLLGISAFFSSSEIAIFSLRSEWLAARTGGGIAGRRF